MRRLFPVKPFSQSNSNNTANNSNGLPQQKIDKDASHTKGGDHFKENSLGSQMMLDYSCPPRKNQSTGGNSNRSSPLATTTVGSPLESSHHRRSQSSSSSIFSEKNESSMSDGSKSSATSMDASVSRSKCTPPAAMPNGHCENRGGKVYWADRPTSVPNRRTEANPDRHPNPNQSFRSNSDRFLDYNIVGVEEEGDIQRLVSNRAPSETIADNGALLSTSRPPRSRASCQDHIASVTGLRRCQSLKVTCPSICEKSSPQTVCDLMSSTRSSGSSGSYGSDKVSSRFQSAWNVAERLVRALPGKPKSKEANIDEEETVLIHCDGRLRREFLESHQTQVSELGSFHSLGAEEVSSPSKFSESASMKSQGLSYHDCRRSNEGRQFSTGDVQSIEELKEVDRSWFQMWLNGYEKTEDDEELERKAIAAEEQVTFFEKDLDSANWHYSSKTEAVSGRKSDQNVGLLREKLIEVCQDRKNLAHVVSSEIRNRMRDRSAACKALNLIKEEMESRTILLENEKSKLQSSLEKELDRRSHELALMLEKVKLDEKRLRERVRNLAEQNVALQREISSLNNREMSSKNQVKESQLYADNLQTKLADAENEIIHLRETLSEAFKKAKQAEDDRDSIKRSHKEKEKENSDLQKSVVRMQRLCHDQEKTIGGLLQGLENGISDGSQDKDNRVTKLQKEQQRLIGVEQALRNELAKYIWENDALKHENNSLLERVRSKEKGTGFGFIKLDRELWDRLGGLEAQALPLLEETAQLSGKLLDFVRHNLSAFDASEIDEDDFSKSSVANGLELDQALELEMNLRSVKRKVDSWKKSVWLQKEVLKEKSHLSCNESLKEEAEHPEAQQSEMEHVEAGSRFNELQQELKGETLLVKILREKLCSKEDDLERLQEEVVTLIRSQEVLRSKNGSLQDRLSSSNHKVGELEFVLGEKENTIRILQADIQDCLKELTMLRGEILKISEERDTLQQHTEQLSWQNLKLKADVEALKKRVETLDEDVLLKEGQLSILQESLVIT